MSDALNKLTIAGARDALRKGDTTSVELTAACLKATHAAAAPHAIVPHTPAPAMASPQAAGDGAHAGGAPPPSAAAPEGTPPASLSVGQGTHYGRGAPLAGELLGLILSVVPPDAHQCQQALPHLADRFALHPNPGRVHPLDHGAHARARPGPRSALDR